MTRKQNYVKGAFILIFANLIVKVIGALFKIPMQHFLGINVMSSFNQAYQLFAMLLTVSTTGLPVAISRIVAASNVKNNRREVEKIYSVSMKLLLVIGIVGAIILAAFSKVIANFLAVPELFTCIIAISPALFFICIISSFRGYFQGLQNMIPTALSQTIEALSKLILGLAAGIWAKSQGFSNENIAACVLLAISVGMVFSFLYLFMAKCYGKAQRMDEISPDMPVRSSKSILKELVSIAIPITLSASIMYITSLIDASLVIKRLIDIGHTKDIAQNIYGTYSSMVLVLYNLPPNFVNPFAISIIPQISANLAKGLIEESKKVMDTTLRICSTIILPCAIGMGALAKPIISLLFKNEEVMTDIGGNVVMAFDLAGQLLTLLAPSILFVSLIYVSSAILQATGNEKLSIISALSGVTVKLVSSYILLGIPSIGIYGTPISTTLCYLVIIIFNFFFLVRKTGYTPSLKRVFLKPLIASACCGAAALGAHLALSSFLGGKIATLGAIGVAVIVYAAILLAIKGLNRDDVKMLPKGEKLCSLLERFKLI